jgi:hypothetical protein
MMRVKVLRDATLTVKAGQIIDIIGEGPALNLGMVVLAEEEAPAEKAAEVKKAPKKPAKKK